VVLVSNPGSESMTVYLLETWMRFPSQTNTLRGWLRMHFWHLSMQWVGPMRIVQLLVVMTLLQIGVCFSQSKAQQSSNPPKPAKSKSSDTKAKPPKPQKEKQSAQNGTKLHPEQERAYTQAYKTGAVTKP